MKLSRRIQEIQPSPTLGVTARANALKAAGEKVFSLAAGEPDFPTPDNICKAAFRAIEAGQTRYTPSAGIPALREAISRKYKQELGLNYTPDQVAVCCGAKQCLFNVFQALLDPGSEAIILAPYWVSYTEQIRLCGSKPVIVPPRAGTFALDLNAIAQAITSRTRLIVINSPCNPTGYVLSESEIDGVAELARKHDLVVISDDIYCHFIYEDRRVINIGQRHPELVNQMVLINGVSKTYSMTGWRLGYAVGPKEIIGAMYKLQDQSTSNATSFVQYAAIEALASPLDVITNMVQAFARRRRRMLELFALIPEVSCAAPDGAFYMFPSFAKVLGRKHSGETIDSTVRLAEILLDQERVAVIPGEGFGAPGHMRFSFAASMETIEEGLKRVQNLVQSLS
jgi:aspartate aminotransferase